MVLGHTDQGILVPGFVAVGAGDGQLKEPQEKGGRQLFVGLVISDQDEHVQVAAHLLVEPVGQELRYRPPLYPYLPNLMPQPCSLCPHSSP